MFDSKKIFEMNDNHPIPPEFLEMIQHYGFFNRQEKFGLVPRKTSKKSAGFRKEGNGLYQRTKHNETASHRMILSLYTQSIAYAPNGSEELALALSNRSALWLHLNKYDLCLTDVDRALGITTSDDLKRKLVARRMKCSQLNQLTSQNCSRLNKLPQFTRSELIPCAADCVKLECDEKFGRHYRAACDIKPGKVIISEKSPYTFLKSQHRYLACSHCLAFAPVGIPCDSCVHAIYCNENCRSEAWSQYHDIQCAITSFLTCEGLMKRNLFDFSYLAKIMIINVRKEGLKNILKEVEQIESQKGVHVKDLLCNDRLNCTEFRFLYSLTRRVEDEPRVADEFIPIVLSLLLPFLMQECKSSKCQIDCRTLLVSAKMILIRLHSIQQCNSYAHQASSYCACPDLASCTPGCLSRIGAILAPCSSLINHSCYPNVSRISIPGPRIVLFTLRPIKKGEQICTTYGPESTIMSREDRRAHLLWSHGFYCDCKACHEDWPTLLEMETQLNLSHLQKIWTCFSDSFARKYLEIQDIVETKEKLPCSKELLDDAIQMVNMTYKNLDDKLAYYVAEKLERYIDDSFSYFYGESVDLPDTC